MNNTAIKKILEKLRLSVKVLLKIIFCQSSGMQQCNILKNFKITKIHCEKIRIALIDRIGVYF